MAQTIFLIIHIPRGHMRSRAYQLHLGKVNLHLRNSLLQNKRFLLLKLL